MIQARAEELPDARTYGCDVTDASAIASTFAAIRSEMGEVDVLVYNPGAGVWRSIEEITAEDFEHSWRVNALGSFLVSKQVIPAMKQAGRGNIVFIGATALLVRLHLGEGEQKQRPLLLPKQRNGV
jgi:NAD(P)-dependent dehydrogenase (short-subunit alcohol dehydrogenase family)